MFNKMSEIKIIVEKTNAAILSITESWLDDSHTNESISIEGYNFVRRDRMTHAGGVIMYIRSDLAYNHRDDLQNDNLEDLWVELLLPKTKPIYVGTCYRAPHNNNLKESLELSLMKLKDDCDTFILGDFNFCWLKIKNNFSIMKHFTQLIDFYNFDQIIDKATRVTQSSATLLDHIYVNNKEIVSQSGVIETGISDHFMIYCTRKISRGQIGKHNLVKIRSMKRYCKELLIEKLQSIEWLAILQSTDINVAWESFKTIFTQVVDDVAPEKEIRIKVRSEPWINSEILELIYERDKILSKVNSDKSNKDLRAQFNKMRNKVTKTIRQTKANYFRNKVEENKYNPKLLWKQFKSIGYRNKIKEKSRIVLDINNEKCFDSDKITNYMCEFFTNIAKNLQNKITDLPKIFCTTSQIFKDFYTAKGITPKSRKFFHVTEDFVYKELRKLNPCKSTGVDGIKARFLKDGAYELKGIITYLVNLSIDTHTVPDELKFAIVKPLFKKNSRLDVGNYRPVSILPIISKILERAIYVQIEAYLKENKLLYDYQSGFRRSHSTDSCLTNLSDYIRVLISEGKYVGMVMLDLQKAFDTVDHDILCNKLEAMGYDESDWFRSYLGGRKQVVVANDTRSEPGVVNCGVPQGSILGPLMFLCYINDMPISVTCKLLLYADDSALIVSGSDPKEIADNLSIELNSCREWLMDNKLSLHLGKTESILFGSKNKLRKATSFEVRCNGNIIEQVKSVKYLGLQIDHDLSGDNIVNGILKKAKSRLKFLYKHKHMLSFSCKKTLCSALIQCHFDYSCFSWYPGIRKELAKKLQIMQNKIIRFILDLDSRAHIGNQQLEKAEYLSVPDRVKQLKLGHVFKIVNKTSPSYMNTNFQLLNEIEGRTVTRSTAYNLFVPRVYNQGKGTFFYSSIKDWNDLPNQIKCIKNEKSFKERLKQTLKDNAKRVDNDPFIYY